MSNANRVFLRVAVLYLFSALFLCFDHIPLAWSQPCQWALCVCAWSFVLQGKDNLAGGDFPLSTTEEIMKQQSTVQRAASNPLFVCYAGLNVYVPVFVYLFVFPSISRSIEAREQDRVESYQALLTCVNPIITKKCSHNLTIVINSDLPGFKMPLDGL